MNCVPAPHPKLSTQSASDISGYASRPSRNSMSHCRIALSAVAGDQTGYWIGRGLGPKVFNKPDSRLFKREHVDKTRAFFDKYGGRTIVIAQYVQIVRTFAPVVAGVGHMNYRHFVSFNIVAAFSWGIILPLAGIGLGQFEWVGENIDFIIILIVLASITPMIVEYLRHRAARTRNPEVTVPERDAP